MRRIAFVFAAGLGLAACSTQQMVADHDDQACRAKGLAAGSVAYVDCRSALDKARAEAQAKVMEDRSKSYTCVPQAYGYTKGMC